MKKSELRNIIREEILALTSKSKTIREDQGEFGDSYSTKNVSREDLRRVINMLDAADINYDLDGRGETIEFDFTELNRQQQARVEKIFGAQ